MSPGRAEVERLARLARVRVERDALDGLARDLRSVLRDFERIREVEIEDIPGVQAQPTADASSGGLREDRPGSDPLAESVRDLAPEWRDGFLLCPRLPELGPGGGGAGRPDAEPEDS